MASTLYEFYTDLGVKLPSISDRAQLYASYNLGSAASYKGTAAQNDALLGALNQASTDPAQALIDELTPYKSILESTSIGDVLSALSTNDPTVLSMLSAYGVGMSDINSALNFFGQFSSSATLYDALVSLYQTNGQTASNTAEGLDTPPAVVDWTQTQSGGNTSMTSPEYTVDFSSGSYSMGGYTLDNLPGGLSKDDAYFLAGKGWDAFKRGAVSEIVSTLKDALKAEMSSSAYNILNRTYTDVSDTKTLGTILKTWGSDIIDNMLSLKNLDEDRSGYFDSRTGQMVLELDNLLAKRLGSMAAKIIPSIIDTRAYFTYKEQSAQKSTDGATKTSVSFGLDIISDHAKFVAENGTAVSVIAKADGDIIYGANRNDLAIGQDGKDSLFGRDGDDMLFGNGGNDTINGGNGDDLIFGGKGLDKLTGGSGKDTFVYKALSDSTFSKTGQDVIYDFAKGDHIDLSALDANTKKAGNQAFSFLGTKAFSGHAGELRYEKQASGTNVYVDVNGDKKIDFAIHFDHAISFAKGDFLL